MLIFFKKKDKKNELVGSKKSYKSVLYVEFDIKITLGYPIDYPNVKI